MSNVNLDAFIDKDGLMWWPMPNGKYVFDETRAGAEEQYAGGEDGLELEYIRQQYGAR